MSKLTLYTGLKTDLLTVTYTNVNNVVIRFKRVELWRNLLERENIEQPRLFPACFIEYMPSNYRDLLKGIQQYDMIVRLHICFESYKDEDTDILGLVDATFTKMQLTQHGFFGVMKRRNEEQNFDHNNVQDYIQDYDCGTCKDYGSDNRADTDATVTPSVTIDFKQL